MPKIYQRFLDGAPIYLARHYWWAYLWHTGVWFFDHQPIINAILFGQYMRLMHVTLDRFSDDKPGRVLQLTCVYGQFTSKLLGLVPTGLHIADVADIQLHLARRKAASLKLPPPLHAARMNAECLGYKTDSFDTIILFFLLHEMPPEARANTLSEAMRVLKPGGRMLITEYTPLPRHHLLYRFPPSRWLLEKLEPFLPGFWRENRGDSMRQAALIHNKSISPGRSETQIFSGFYQVASYKLMAHEDSPLT
ncbi:MAG: methyltransferase domain-containing protein [Mariprofundaceae bacterium]